MPKIKLAQNTDIKIIAHRGCGATDNIGTQSLPDAKGEALKTLPPENSEEAIESAFKNGYSVEIDVTMTKRDDDQTKVRDTHLIVTHTNDLTKHSKDAKTGDYVSEKTLEEIQKMQTGLGGRTSAFLTYEKFIKLMRNHPNISANVEIKGTIQDEPLMKEPHYPSLIDKLIEKTPKDLYQRIIWSSFANSNIVEMKKRGPGAKVAQLMAEPERFEPKGFEDPVYPDTDDRYMQFTVRNLQELEMKKNGISAVHPCIDSLMSEEGKEAVKFCADNGIAIRTWALSEKNPGKDFPASKEAKKQILNVLEFKKRYPNLTIDIITDYPKDVQAIIETHTPEKSLSAKVGKKNIPRSKNTFSF